MIPRTLSMTLTAFALLAATASAQTQSLFGDQGPVAQNGTGASATGAAFEQGGPQITTELGQASGTVGQSGFVGRGGNEAFIGGTNIDAQGGGAGGGTTNFRGGGSNFRSGGTGNQGGNRNQGRQNNTGTRLGIFRPTQRIAFDFEPRQRVAVVRTVAVRIERIASRRPELAGVTVAFTEDGRATLQGAVPSENAARLAMALVRLEPGVRAVESQLAVQDDG